MLFFCGRIISYLLHLYIYTENIIFPCISWERSSFIFRPKKKYHAFWKKIPYFQIIQEISYSRAIFFGKTIFSGHLKKIYFYVFFWERSSFIVRLKNNIIFSGKRNIFFPDNIQQERSYSSAIFLERSSFHNIWRKYHISIHLSFSV